MRMTNQAPSKPNYVSMITKKVIDALYKKYRKRPAGIELLDVGLLFEYASEHHNIVIDEEGNLVINSIDPASPFHKLALSHIHGITQFDDVVVIILHSSIVFLNKKDSGINVHIKFDEPSIWEKIRWKVSGK